MGILFLSMAGLNSCSNDDDEYNYKYDKVNMLEVSRADKNETYKVSDPICFTDGLTSNYKAPTFFCRLDEASGFKSLYIGYKYNERIENTNNHYLEGINSGDILEFDDYQVLLSLPIQSNGWSIEMHQLVATSGTIKVIEKKGKGNDLSITLKLTNVAFTSPRVLYSRTRGENTTYCIINGIVKFVHTDKYYEHTDNYYL